MNTNYYQLLLFTLLTIFYTIPTNAQISITFQIDMNYQIELGKFNSNTEWVEVAGTFNGWSGSGRFQDEDGDGLYELTIDGFREGENIAYKFRLNGQWDGREEFPGEGNDRTHTVGSTSETLFHWYNNETPPDAALVADFNASLREFYEDGIISFLDRSSGQVTSWEWVFEGGTPSTSNERNPIVRYDEPGRYNVQLTVNQGDKTNTIILEEYVNVLERNTTDIPWWNETVFYEIFVRSFQDSDGDGIGDFKGITERLDYLNDGDPSTDSDLGITGIWLMPIHEAASYHGYDVIDYTSVSEEYGGMDDFRTFLEEAHKRGIRVIIDFVINHNSRDSEWFQNALTGPDATYRDYYIWSDNNPGYSGPWGQQVWHQRNGEYYYGVFWDGMPDLNFNEPRVKEEIFDAADFWLEDVGIDGFRLDAVKFLIEEDRQLEDTESTYLFWNEFNSQIKAANPDAFSVGEAWTNTEKVVNYVINDRIDYCFEFDLAGNILSSVNNGQVGNLYGQMQKMYNIYPHLQYGTFLANHDQNRLMNSVGNDESKVKLAAAVYLTLPGIPYLYYGEEIGMIGQKPDEDIRRPMQWDDSQNAGFTTGNPWRGIPSNFTQYNVAEEATNPNSLLNTYKSLIQLRNSEKALQLGTYEAVSTNNANVFAFLRQYEGDTLLVVHNMGTNNLSNLGLTFNFIDFDGVWEFTELLDGADSFVEEVSDNQTNNSLTLGSRATKVFNMTRVLSTSTVELDNQGSITLFPNPTTNHLTIATEQLDWQLTDYRIFDTQGRMVGEGKIDLGNQQAILPTHYLSEGLYQLQLQHGTIVEKIAFLVARK